MPETDRYVYRANGFCDKCYENGYREGFERGRADVIDRVLGIINKELSEVHVLYTPLRNVYKEVLSLQYDENKNSTEGQNCNAMKTEVERAYIQGKFCGAEIIFDEVLEIIDNVVAPDDIETIYQAYFYMASDEIKTRILELKGEQK